MQRLEANLYLTWLPAVIWAGLIFFASHQPKATFEKLGLTGELLSSAGHLIVYAVLMFLLVRALRRTGPAGRSYATAFALAALYGLSDEFHQSFVPGRTATLIDWALDLIGAGSVWLVFRRREQALLADDETV